MADGSTNHDERGDDDVYFRSPDDGRLIPLGPREHARLIHAARVFGMRPNVLARLLTVRGVDRALREARRDP